MPGLRMLSVRSLVVGYGPVTALAGIDLDVNEGEIVCVIGPNGAGKTTLMKTAAGVLRPRSGKVSLDGAALAAGAVARVRAGIALVPEGRRMFAPLTVRDNLELGAYVRLTRGEYAAVASDLARVYEIFPRLKERSGQAAGLLSGGEQQMVAIGRALMGRPRLLLLDEPSMGLAPLVVAEIFSVIRRLHTERTTVLIAEQNASMALSVSQRAYVIEAGLVVKAGSAAALAGDPAVRETYLGGA
jgi:branched-chain amino acid transport system ATP-binding protein